MFKSQCNICKISLIVQSGKGVVLSIFGLLIHMQTGSKILIVECLSHLIAFLMAKILDYQPKSL